MKRREFLTASGAALGASYTSAVLAEAGIAPEPTMRIAPNPTPIALALPNVILRTHNNKEVRLYEDLLKGKIFSINMFFIACVDGKCPYVTANLARVQPLIGPRLGRDIFMYSITLEPELDTPKRLREYMANFKIHPGWTFLTGKKEDIELLRRGLGYWDPDPERDKLKTTHSGLAQMGNEPLDRWMACPTMAEPREIRRVLSYLDWPKGWPKNGVQKAS